MRNVVVALGLFAGLLCAEAHAATVRGKVAFQTRRGQRPALNETLVSLEPIGRSATSRKTASTFQMTTRGKTFLPHVLAVPAGSTVTFPNEDPISHNLFSLAPGNTFDLGLYRKGAGKAHKFDAPGVVNVYCNIHPNMSAVVQVMSTPYYAFTDAAGAFMLDVPPGRYRLNAWNEQGGSAVSEVEVKADGKVAGTTEITIDGRSQRVQQHRNKEGKPYQKPRDY